MKQKFIRCFFFYSFLLVVFFQAANAKKIIYIEPGSCGDLFNINDPHGNRDDVRRPFYELKIALNKLGYEVRKTYRLNNLSDAKVILIFNVPRKIEELRRYPKEKLILFLWEPEAVMPRNYQKKYHEYFGRVYTWMDDLVDNERYFKFYYPQNRLDMIQTDVSFEEKKLCTMIFSNKFSQHPNSLYEERRKVIKFFERNFCDDFDLYGFGWSSDSFKNYKGIVASKIDCLKNYKFCFAYENQRDVEGWVTEKIFDVFKAGGVPIYWGAKNIDTFIPKNCRIDRSDFGSQKELYQFLKKMTKEEYQGYIDNIKRYLRSPQAHLYSNEMFIDIVISAINPDYDKYLALTEEQRTSLALVKDYSL